MGDLSANFSRREFRCPCGCGLDTADYLLIVTLEQLRSDLGNRRITVTSGYRCEEHNSSKDVGGVPNSQHLYGKAADIVVSGVDPLVVAIVLDEAYPETFGIGHYSGHFTHIDVRPVRARWGAWDEVIRERLVA